MDVFLSLYFFLYFKARAQEGKAKTSHLKCNCTKPHLTVAPQPSPESCSAQRLPCDRSVHGMQAGFQERAQHRAGEQFMELSFLTKHDEQLLLLRQTLNISRQQQLSRPPATLFHDKKHIRLYNQRIPLLVAITRSPQRSAQAAACLSEGILVTR